MCYSITVKKGYHRKQNVVAFIAIILWNEGKSKTAHTNCASKGNFFLKIVFSILILARTINAQAIIHSDLILYECHRCTMTYKSKFN